FKAGRIDFEDVLNQNLRGAVAPTARKGGINAAQVGLGVAIGGIDNFMTQGDLQPTGKGTDLAIPGDGFSQLSDGRQTLYTGEGSFDVGSDGRLVQPSTGLLVQGWQADETGAIDTGQPVSDLNIPFNRMSPPSPSTSVSIAGNLDSRAAD